MRSAVALIFGLTAAIAVISCTNPSSGTDVKSYSVTYNLNGGRGSAPVDSNTYAAGQEVTTKPSTGITDPRGKTFVGWNTQADGNGIDVRAGGTITMQSAGITLYAKWADGTYSVTYNLNGGGGSAPVDSNIYATGQEVTTKPSTGITDPRGKTFVGWNTQADGNGIDVRAGGTITMQSAGITLYAKWTDGTYSVTYNLNGGGGSAPVDSNTYVIGQRVTTKPSTGITAPRGRVFAGWNTRASGKGATIQAGRTIRMVRGGLTLYAKWKKSIPLG